MPVLSFFFIFVNQKSIFFRENVQIKNKMKKIIIYFIIILNFIGCNIESKDNLQLLCDSLKEQLAACKENNEMVENLSNRYKSHLTRFGQIQDSITKREKAIDSLKDVIAQRGSASQIENKILNQMLEQIDEFIQQNQEIAEEMGNIGYKNSHFKQVINILLNSSASKQKELNYLKKQMSELQEEVNGLHLNNEILKERVDYLEKENKGIKKHNSRLTLSNIKIEIPKNLAGIERKAKNIDSIIFSFNINANDYAKHKNIEIFARMTDKQGNVIYNSPDNIFDFNGKELAYTATTNADYNGKKTPIRFKWIKRGNQLQQGNYIVTFFIDNYEVATESFSIK